MGNNPFVWRVISKMYLLSADIRKDNGLIICNQKQPVKPFFPSLFCDIARPDMASRNPSNSPSNFAC